MPGTLQMCGNVQVALPTQPPWYQLFDVRFEDICEVCCEMQALYARPKAQYIDVREEKQVSDLVMLKSSPFPCFRDVPHS